MINSFQRIWMRSPLRVLLVLLVLIVISLLAVVSQRASPRGGSSSTSAIATIDRWATAAETGDLATARDLLVDEPLQRVAFESRWPNTLRVYGIVPGHQVSNVVQHGQSTTATVHFRTGDGAFCMNVMVDQQSRVMIVNEVGRCPFPAASAAP